MITAPHRAQRSRLRGAMETAGERQTILIADRYRVVRTLGQGGMGIVYEAWDVRLQRHVALKLLLRAGDAHAGAAERMFREARVMAALVHDHVVSAFDVGVHEGQVFIAMQLIQGTTLRQWIKDAPRSDSEKLRVLIGAGRGLAAAHAAKIIHRDFKPDNVLIDTKGIARVTDFGIARQFDCTDALRASGIDPLGSTNLTQSGVSLGTPAYMAPEQALGRTVTPLADQFSFCATVWELFAGQRPFAGTNVAELYANVLSGEIVPTETTAWPSGLEHVLRKGLAVEPERRYPSLEALLVELERIAARRPSKRRRLPSRFAVVVGGPGLIAACGALALLLGRTDMATPPSPPDIAVDEAVDVHERSVTGEATMHFADTTAKRRTTHAETPARAAKSDESIASAPAPAPKPGPTAEERQLARDIVDRALRAADDLRVKRHLLNEDIAGYAANREQALAAVTTGDFDGAQRLAGGMQAQIEGVRIDTHFIEAKVARLSKRAAAVKLDAVQSKVLHSRLASASSAAASDQLDVANQHLTEVGALLGIR